PVERAARRPTPGDDRLTLIGDADGRDRFADGSDEFGRGAHDGAPDLLGVVFDPAGTREELPELPISVSDGPPPLVDGERADPGGARIEGDDDRHGNGGYRAPAPGRVDPHADRDPHRRGRLPRT